MVILGVEDEPELLAWEKRLGPLAHAFTEPDLSGQKTALAVSPAADHRQFRHLKLL